MEFAYKVRDSQGHTALIVSDVLNPAASGELKGRVLLTRSDAPTDPDFAQQWYLGAVGVPNVWKDFTGDGVRVLVLEPSGVYAVESQVAISIIPI